MRRAATAVAAGALLAAAFPRPAWPALAWIALAPLMVLALTARSAARAAATGLLFGLAFHALTFAWWYGLLRSHGRLSHPEAAAVFAFLAVYIAAYPAIFAAGLRRIAFRRGPAAALLLAPALWAGLELVRGLLFTGLPWSLVGASQQPWPLMIQVADRGGVTAVSLVVAAGNAFVAWIALCLPGGAPAARLMPAGRLALILAALPAATAAYGALRLAAPELPAPAIRVGIVQGTVPQDEKWEASARMKILDAHLEATREAALRGATLVVWPESSVPLPLTSAEAYRSMLERESRLLGIDLLVGSVHYDASEEGQVAYNSAFLLSGRAGGRATHRYDKMHLVPFGEYVPLRAWMGPVEKMVEEASDFSPGAAPGVIVTESVRLGPFICFEAIFPSLVRRFTAEGAQVLVNLTNDAFLGDTAGPPQHLALAAMRAVENRRWMVRAANTGISALVDPAGRIVSAAPYGTREVLVADVPLLDARSLYTRAGDAAGWACVIVAAGALIAPPLRGAAPSSGIRPA